MEADERVQAINVEVVKAARADLVHLRQYALKVVRSSCLFVFLFLFVCTFRYNFSLISFTKLLSLSIYIYNNRKRTCYC